MPKSYASRSALKAEETGVSPNYKYTVWALPESEIEESIIEFLKRRHPKSITLSMQGIVDKLITPDCHVPCTCEVWSLYLSKVSLLVKYHS